MSVLPQYKLNHVILNEKILSLLLILTLASFFYYPQWCIWGLQHCSKGQRGYWCLTRSRIKLSCPSLLSVGMLKSSPGSPDRSPPCWDTKLLCPGREAGTQTAETSAMQPPAGGAKLWNEVAGSEEWGCHLFTSAKHLTQNTWKERAGYFHLIWKQLAFLVLSYNKMATVMIGD